MDVGTSKGLESFLAFLRETTERHRMAEADRAEAEAATQDLLHALELGDDKAPGRARLGLKIREVRRQRRTAKDIAEQTRPVVDWVEQNHIVYLLRPSASSLRRNLLYSTASLRAL